MKKDIVDLIKEQGNQACVMIPDIMDTPTIDLGEVGINEGVEKIELSTDQQQRLIDFLDKHENNSRFLLELKSISAGLSTQLLMTRSIHKVIEGTNVNLSTYASNLVNTTLGEQVTIYIYVITFLKTEEMQNVLFGVKTLK